MKTLQVTDSEALDEASRTLKNGGVLMYPTETCYGLGVDIFNRDALKKLYRLKGRDADKPVSILVDGLGMAMEYGVFSDKALELAHKYWPGPFSIVVPRTKKLPEFFNAEEEFVSIRHSGNNFCEDLPWKFGGPITTTSANFSGERELYEVDVVKRDSRFSEVNLLIDGGVLSSNKPSTVVKVDGDRLTILRQGDIVLE